jgi:hypothetical protein
LPTIQTETTLRRPRHNDFRGGWLTSGANRGLAK